MSALERLAAIAAASKKPKPPSSVAKPSPADNWATAPLSNKQKARIGQLANHAYTAQKYIDIPLTEWRRQEQEIACGVSSLRDANQTHFLSLCAHFQKLAGDHAASQATWAKTGRYGKSPIMHDTHENRKTVRAKIHQALQDHEAYFTTLCLKPAITYGYVLSIVKNQNKKPIDDLTAPELQRLLFTIKNRIAAKEGKGHSKNRNKSQRGK